MSVVSAYALVNGVQIDLEQNTETGFWEATAVAPAKSSYTLDGHYYGVTITAFDEAGNETSIDVTDTEFGEALQLVVKETVAPEITIISPTEGELTSNNTPQVCFDVTDDDSGVDLDTLVVKIDGVEAANVSDYYSTDIDNGYEISFVPSELEDGEHTIEIDISDYDGNQAETASVTFSVQTSAPSLAVTSPSDDTYFNDSEVTVAGTTDGTTITVQINDGDPVTVEVVDGEFSQVFELEEGENTITITATSEAGVETVITRTVTIDTHAPIFKSISLKPNPVDAGKTYVISVEVVDE